MTTRSYSRPSKRRTGDNPERRLLAAVVLRTYRDLMSSNPRVRGQAARFFDEEGIAWAAAFGIPGQKVRRKLAEVLDGRA